MPEEDQADLLVRLEALRPYTTYAIGFATLLDEVIAEIKSLRSHIPIGDRNAMDKSESDYWSKQKE